MVMPQPGSLWRNIHTGAIAEIVRIDRARADRTTIDVVVWRQPGVEEELRWALHGIDEKTAWWTCWSPA